MRGKATGGRTLMRPRANTYLSRDEAGEASCIDVQSMHGYTIGPVTAPSRGVGGLHPVHSLHAVSHRRLDE